MHGKPHQISGHFQINFKLTEKASFLFYFRTYFEQISNIFVEEEARSTSTLEGRFKIRPKNFRGSVGLESNLPLLPLKSRSVSSSRSKERERERKEKEREKRKLKEHHFSERKNHLTILLYQNVTLKLSVKVVDTNKVVLCRLVISEMKLCKEALCCEIFSNLKFH